MVADDCGPAATAAVVAVGGLALTFIHTFKFGEQLAREMVSEMMIGLSNINVVEDFLSVCVSVPDCHFVRTKKTVLSPNEQILSAKPKSCPKHTPTCAWI